MGADCKYCGAYISGDQPKCPACGKRQPVSGANKNSGDFSSHYSSGAATQAAPQDDWDSQEKERQAQWFEAQRKSQEESFDRQRERQNKGDTKPKPGYTQWQETFRSERERAKANRQDNVKNSDDAGITSQPKRYISYLCYLGILFFIPLIAYPDDEFIRYHSNQGLALFFTFIVAGLTTFWLIWVFAVFCFLKGIVNVNKGVMQPLPIIGRFKFIK